MAAPSLRCLLVAPTPGIDGESGDLQYCRDLLADPPEGVEYVTYAEALASGELREAASVRRARDLLLAPSGLATAGARVAVHLARRADVLLPDPIRWWEVVGEFDVVHAHCFPVRLSGRVPPVVVTDSAGTFWYWTAARGRPAAGVWRRLRRERRLARALGCVHPTATPDLAARALYFVEGGRGLASRLGVAEHAIDVAPAGVPSAASRAPLALAPPRLLFVARNFDIKGGPDVLRAFAAVRRVLPACELVVAGTTFEDRTAVGVRWLGPTTRERLYADVYPTADLFVYPTRFDCAPLVVAEALAHGVPVVGSRAFGLPDLVQDGTTGLLVEPGRPDALAEALLALLGDPVRLRTFGAAAAADFAERLSATARNEALRTAYADVVRERSERPPRGQRLAVRH